MTQGNDFSVSFVVQQNGSPVNLTGATLRLMAKYAPTDADASAVINISSPSSGITIDNAATGAATFVIPRASTTYSTFPTQQSYLYYDLQLTTSTPKVYTILYGTLTINPYITRTSP